MTTSPHTPDPAMGAIIDALGGGTGIIDEADDNEPMRAAIDRLTTEQLANWIAYIRNSLRVGVADADARLDALEPVVAAMSPYIKQPPVAFPTNADAAYDRTAQIYHVTTPTGLRQYYYDSTPDAPDGFQWTLSVYDVAVGVTVEIHRDPPPFIGTLVIAVPGPFAYLTMILYRANGRVNLGPFSTDGTPTSVVP
jgi:hypothetical protein